ncbi:MAG TPA: ABC transporter permease [Terriglobales bacterium]|nr:ABC transporter permease [Terriglobales bacterium]
MFWSDLKFGLRLVLKAPGASLIAMLALGLGIGANTAIFSVANGILLHPLPYAHLGRVLDLSEVPPHSPPTATNNVSGFNYEAWRQQAQAFAAMAAYRYDQFNLRGAGTPAMVTGARVSSQFFALLPAPPLRGRTFLPAENQPGHERVAILSRELWEHQFGARPDIVGQTVELNQEAYTVVGILGPEAVMPQTAELWLPLALTPAQRQDRSDHFLHVIGRLRAGVAPGAAAAELRTIVERTDAAYPATNRGWGIHVQPLAQRIIGNETASYVFLLMGAVGFLLLIACANVANLQFARALGRNHELALRTALGAGRGRLLRQLLTENILLGLGGAVVGTGFAAVSIRLILAYMPADVAQWIGGWSRIQLDSTALLFTLGIALLAGLAAGVAPAWHASRPDLNATLKEGGRGAIGHSRRRLRSALVVVQIALALILLVGAGLMVQGFAVLLNAGQNFQGASVLTAAADLPKIPQYAQPSARAAFWQQALAKLGALPGVAAAGTASFLPLGNNLSESGFSIEGRPIADASRKRYAVVQAISPNFFALLQIPLLSGRGFTASDGTDAPAVAIVSRRLAQRYFPGRDPIGEHVKVGGDAASSRWLTIVGVSADVTWAWGDTNPEYTLYRPAAQAAFSSAYFLLRGAGGGNVTALGGSARRAVAAVDAQQPLYQVMSLAESIHDASIGLAYVAVMLTVAGVLALVLAAIGVYGVMAFLVSERVHEFGIRRALGASQGAILGLVLRRGAGMLAWGFALGLPVAYLLARGLQSLILGISPGDLATYAAICLVLAAMAAIACLVPARHATRVDPLIALREP